MEVISRAFNIGLWLLNLYIVTVRSPMFTLAETVWGSLMTFCDLGIFNTQHCSASNDNLLQKIHFELQILKLSKP